MKSFDWQTAAAAAPDPERARRFFEQLDGISASAAFRSPELSRILAAFASGSSSLASILLAHPEWIAECCEANSWQQPRQKQSFFRELRRGLDPLLESGGYDAAFGQVRAFNRRERIRIAARDLAGLADVPEITAELSDLADVCLQAAYDICRARLAERLGTPFHQTPAGSWTPTDFCILGLGKLGGRELNYSSDVDLIFIYDDEGYAFKMPPGKRAKPQGLASHQYFARLIEMFVSEVTRLTDHGALYRVDLRLRPEGDPGPLARSIASYENYYAQWGQTWERMMLIKARCVAGSQALAAEFVETIQPFRYPRSISDRILHEIAAVKQRTEKEVVKSGELDRNVKLGRGGIREIEFVAQAHQLLHAGKSPFLQGNQTLPVLQKLVEYHLLAKEEAMDLDAAYVFLRRVEHRLQMENDEQTHTIPLNAEFRVRLAALMGARSLPEFENALQTHTRRVRQIYERFIRLEETKPAGSLPREVEGAEAEWKNLFKKHNFRDPGKALQLVQIFVHGPGYSHVSTRTSELALNLIDRFLKLCPSAEPQDPLAPPSTLSVLLSDPDRVLARLDSFVEAYSSRAMLYELWESNPSLFNLLLLLFDRSEFLAEIAIRTPDLLDTLELSGQLRRRKAADEILRDLEHGRADADQQLWLRKYHQAEFFRIGLRDILGLADFEQNLAELSALADACLQYALGIVLRRHRLKKPPLAIIGLGKLGGAEINYGSDLDLMFVAPNRVKDLPKLQRLAAEVMELLSSHTELGVAFQTDARLRPDGEKGLLVNTLRAHEEYYRHRALLWEIQALSRARPVAGDPATGGAFLSLVQTLTNFQSPSLPLAAFRSDWMQAIGQMRTRIEKERTPKGKDHLAIKTGAGGLMDAEFVAQALCMRHNLYQPNTLSALEHCQSARISPPECIEPLLANYRHLRRIEGILRRWSYAGETLLPDNPAPLYRVAVRCGFPHQEAFLAAVASYRAAIRRAYLHVFPR